MGLVWIAWAARGGKAEARRFRFKGSRAAIRNRSADAALAGLIARVKRG